MRIYGPAGKPLSQVWLDRALELADRSQVRRSEGNHTMALMYERMADDAIKQAAKLEADGS